MGYRLQRLKARRKGRYAMAARTTAEQLPDNPAPDNPEQPGGPKTVTLTPVRSVRPVTPLTELESTVPGAPDEEKGAVTGLRLIYTGRELQEITVITDGEDVPYRTDLTFSCPTWLPRP
ncbi:hypothetical protein ABZ926_30825 [Streptomyces litmocidini]|uniref:hypothetical protein n=1 Tax=Streptomyces litmocidini TaxID=67318 RepID=UPI00340F1CD7